MTTSELLALRIRQLAKHEEDLATAAETLRQARVASREEFNRRFHARLIRKEHKPGSLVLIRNTHERRPKSDPRYFGPYQVIRYTRGGAYKLAELDGTELADSVAAFRLIPYITRIKPELEKLAKLDKTLNDESASEGDVSEIKPWELDSD